MKLTCNTNKLVVFTNYFSSSKKTVNQAHCGGVPNSTFHFINQSGINYFQAGEDSPLLYLSLWHNHDVAQTKFWFANDTKGQSYRKDIMAIDNVQDYYNKMASDYEESMFGWGYCMPEAIADALVKHGGLKMEASILDLGCGNGLCGQALHNRGIEDINGIDFSRWVICILIV